MNGLSSFSALGLEGEGGGRERVPAVEDAALGAHGERQREVPEVDLRPEVVRHGEDEVHIFT